MTAPLRALGLIRVSKERDGLVSPDLQRTSIVEHAAKHGLRVTGWLEGIDESGSQARSAWWPRLEQAVAAVEAREYDVIVVWKFSRTARNRLRWATMIDRVESAGGTLRSATEDFDTATSSGRFARGMLAELNAFEAERIGEVWREVHQNRLTNGLTHNGRARFGYTYAGGLHSPDPETGPVLASMYAQYVEGVSVYGITAGLNRRGITTTTGGLWTDSTARRVLDSGFAAGLIYLEHRPMTGKRRTAEPEFIPGAHEPVIGPDLWDAYRAAKRSRARVAPRSQRSPYLLSGLLRCARCGCAMTAGTFGRNRAPKYRCERRRSTAGAGCETGYVHAEHVHAEVFAWLSRLAADVDDAAARADVDGAATRDTAADDAARLAREVVRLEAALVRLAQQHAEDEHSDEQTYRAARDNYRSRIAAANAEHAEVAEVTVRLAVSPAAVAGPLVDDWDTLGVEGRREVLRRLVRFVEVKTHDRDTPADVAVVPLWQRD